VRYPTVSAIVPSYNRGYILDRAVKSIIEQTFENWELIVVDDGSSDNTQQVVEAFDDPRIRYLRHDVNRGVCAARNTAIESVKGNYIAFLDSDDTWLPDKLAKQLQVFQDSSETVGVVYTWLGLTDINGTIKRLRDPLYRGNLRENLLFSNLIGSPSTVMVRSDYLNRGIRFDPQLKYGEDWDFYLQLAQHCEFEIVPEVLVHYCDEETSTSVEAKKATTNDRAVLDGYNILFDKYHDDVNLIDRKLGTISNAQKSACLFNIGQRLFYHGRVLNRKDAMENSRRYLQFAMRLTPFNLRFGLHYLASLMGRNVYDRWNRLEASLRHFLSRLRFKNV